MRSTVVIILFLCINFGVSAATAQIQMKVLNDATGPDVTEVRSRRYDRMNGSSEFIGQSLDLTGVARTTVPYPETEHPGRSKWVTMISPSFFLSAKHFRPGANTTVRFYYSTDPTDFVEREVDSVSDNLGDDVWVGKLKQPVPSGIALYPVMVVQELSNYVGTELWVMGKSGDVAHLPLHGVLPDSVMRNEAIRLRVGRNIISGTGLVSPFYSFSFDASIADIASGPASAPVSGGDGKVDEADENFAAANQHLSLAGYLDGDITAGPTTGPNANVSLGIVDFWDGIEIGTMVGTLLNTDGLGWDEAETQDGDSGGPSFTELNGKLVITGMHTDSGLDSCAGLKYPEILALVQQHSEGTEYPVAISYTTQFVLGDQAWSLPPDLQKPRLLRGDLNGDRLLDDDIDLMSEEIRAYASAPSRPYNWDLDMNDDQVIDQLDLKYLMEIGFNSFWTDIDLNGEVKVIGDASKIVQNLGLTNKTHREGDVNGDNQINVAGDSFPCVGPVLVDTGGRLIIRLGGVHVKQREAETSYVFRGI